jgi:hypothetical protein
VLSEPRNERIIVSRMVGAPPAKLKSTLLFLFPLSLVVCILGASSFSGTPKFWLFHLQSLRKATEEKHYSAAMENSWSDRKLYDVHARSSTLGSQLYAFLS